jgi:GST-like protein
VTIISRPARPGGNNEERIIAGISLLGWVRNLIGFYEAREIVGFDRFLRVQVWLDRGLARPAVQRGLEVTTA